MKAEHLGSEREVVARLAAGAGARRAASAALLAVCVSLAAGACGGSVFIDPPDDRALDAGTTADAADPDCTDPTVCSRMIDHSGACVGRTWDGVGCRSFATPCSTTPPDCDELSAILGLPASLASCDNGLHHCTVAFFGADSAINQDRACKALDAFMQPVDCILE